MLNKQCKVKLIAASLGLAASLNASAAMGGLQVQSNLDEPFAGTVVVTGDEARALAGSAKPTVIGANLTATVIQQSSDRAVIRLRSGAPVKEPVLTFWLGVGNQNRQYTAMLDPRDYQSPAAAPSSRRAAAQETPKTRRERAEPRRQAERERNRSRQAQAPVRVEVVRGSRYQVKDGELLVDIAQRVQPSGMTLRQTINALVRANPKSFRNGNPDLMYSGTTLIIPDAAQLRRLARDSQIRVRPGAAESAAPVETVSGSGAQSQPPAAETQVQTPTPPVAPEQAAKPVEAEAPVAPAASTPETMPLETAASETAAMEASAVSEAMASEVAAVEASEPVMPPVAEPAPAEPVAEVPMVQEEPGDWTQWALYGAGGAVVLGGLAYLLAKRRRKPEAEEALAGTAADDEDDLFFEDINEPAAAGNAAAAPVAGDAVKEDELHLDLSRLAAQQHLGNTPDTETVAATAAEAEAEEDWSWLEEQTEEAAVVSEQPSAAAATAAALGGAATAAAASAGTQPSDDWLAFGDEALPAVETVEADAPVPEAADDLTWVWEEEAAPGAQAPSAQAEPQAVPAAEPAAVVQESAAFDFELPASEGAAEEAALSFDADTASLNGTAPASAAAEAAWQPETDAAAGLDFSADDSLSFAPVQEAPAAAPGFDEQPAALDFNLDSLNFVDDAAQPVVEAPVAAEMPAADLSDLSFEAEAPADAAALEAEALDWAETAQQSAALPQEALEAKLELAKMYLEIDDANTARQTLMELVNESNGSNIQAQAQALLQELG